MYTRPWGCDISEQKVHAAADAMVEKGLLAAGYSYLNLDDCWMAKERAHEVVALNETLRLNNTLQAGANFSSGMRALGQYIHSKGLLFGAQPIFSCSKPIHRALSQRHALLFGSRSLARALSLSLLSLRLCLLL